MHDQIARRKSLLCVVLTAATASGCSIFLPEHSHSNFRENEVVSIDMLKTCADLRSATASVFSPEPVPVDDVYTAAFGLPCQPLPGPKQSGEAESAIAAAAAAAAIGLAVDYVHEQLKKEATLYEAQWEQRIARDDFWNGGNAPGMSYVGFQVTRTVGVGNDTASAAIFGFRASADGQFFLVAPLVYKLDKAKAKVLSDEWPTTYTPWLLLTFPGKFARIAGHSVDTQIAVEMHAFWQNEKGERKTEAIAAFVVPIKGYDIANNPVRYPGHGLPTTPIGWLAAVPRSASAPRGASGNFTLKVAVTEKDTSNAQQLLLQAADTIQEKAPLIQQYIKGNTSTTNN